MTLAATPSFSLVTKHDHGWPPAHCKAITPNAPGSHSRQITKPDYITSRLRSPRWVPRQSGNRNETTWYTSLHSLYYSPIITCEMGLKLRQVGL